MRSERAPDPTDEDLLAAVRDVAFGAGERLLARFTTANRVRDRADLIAALQANEAAAEQGLDDDLRRVRPGARRIAEHQERSALPEGEWWVVDAVEGNVNHVHGLPEFGVSIALVRDGVPVLGAFRQPAFDRTVTAVLGGGAHLDGVPLMASAKEGLELAIAGTGQAEVGQIGTYARIGASVTAMLQNALLVRVEVPSTFPLIRVAAGHTDAFWQYEPDLSGTALGVLVATEAGAVATGLDGESWAPGARDLLVAAPGVHAAALAVLAGVR